MREREKNTKIEIEKEIWNDGWKESNKWKKILESYG